MGTIRAENEVEADSNAPKDYIRRTTRHDDSTSHFLPLAPFVGRRFSGERCVNCLIKHRKKKNNEKAVFERPGNNTSCCLCSESSRDGETEKKQTERGGGEEKNNNKDDNKWRQDVCRHPKQSITKSWFCLLGE